MAKFLQALGLEAYYLAVRRWALEQGACSLSELVENAEDLAAALSLPPPKSAQLQRSADLAQQIEKMERASVPAVPAPVLSKATSTPVAIPMQARLSGPVLCTVTLTGQPHQAGLAPTVTSGIRSAVPVASSMDRTETDLWDEREAAAHGSLGADVDAREPKLPRPDKDQYPRYYTPPKHRCRVDDALLRQRNPSEAEVKVKQLAVAAAEAEALEEWGEISDQPKPKTKQLAKTDRFESMRGQFLDEHGPTLRQELGGGYKLVPADVAPAVKEKFLSECDAHGAPDFGYHGTRSANIPSILSQGLRVPSAASGVRVANGSAHGVGIYTGMPGNYWLSRGFADTRDSRLPRTSLGQEGSDQEALVCRY